VSCLLKSTDFWYHSRSHFNSFIKSLCRLRIVAGFMNTDSMAHGTALWSATFWFKNTRLLIPLAPLPKVLGPALEMIKRNCHRLLAFPLLPSLAERKENKVPPIRHWMGIDDVSHVTHYKNDIELSHACLLTSISRHVNNNWRMRLSSTDSWIENWILWWGCWPEEAARGNWLVFREGRTTDRRMRTRQEI
jgi:hypothetical protein